MKWVYWLEVMDDYGVFVGNVYEFVDMCMESYLGWCLMMYCIFNYFIELDEDGVYVMGEVYNVIYLYWVDNGVFEIWNGCYLD